jgi:hypothetical protein
MQLSYHAMNESELITGIEESEIAVAFLAGPIESDSQALQQLIGQKQQQDNLTSTVASSVDSLGLRMVFVKSELLRPTAR